MVFRSIRHTTLNPMFLDGLQNRGVVSILVNFRIDLRTIQFEGKDVYDFNPVIGHPDRAPAGLELIPAYLLAS